MNYTVLNAYDNIIIKEGIFMPATEDDIKTRKEKYFLIEYDDFIKNLQESTEDGVYEGSLYISRDERGNIDGNILIRHNITSLNFFRDAGIIEILGDLTCDDLKLTSLDGCPLKISEDFSCRYNSLNNLKSGPIEVGGSYNCSNCGLSDFIGAPKKINGTFNCESNNNINLIGVPEIVTGDFKCRGITSLEGCPKEVGGDFIIYNNFKNIKKRDVYIACDVLGEVILNA